MSTAPTPVSSQPARTAKGESIRIVDEAQAKTNLLGLKS